MLGLDNNEMQELLDVIEYSNIQKEFWEIEKRFKEAQYKVAGIPQDELHKYMQLYEDNYSEIENVFKKELQEKRKIFEKDTDQKNNDLSIEMLNTLTDIQIEELSCRIMAEDYYGINFGKIEIVKEYIQNDLDTHNDINKLNNYLNDYGVEWDVDKMNSSKDNLINYIIQIYPPISKFPEVANRGLQLINQTLGNSE